ncbi:hypothetical protein DNK47_01090 [Mycoplasma wenyonii]|uniref:Uncharacterized protein n=1 Tax=Mycoplasma wenyonii TaxID=65123 RepID=A0A328PS98_9MOLU|nr:hypothetical protein [Mycoplasma wenyonii]RAO95207.1 hypothetical protein DNK47_01090 [Mycoplasma wenyonii]
MALKALFPAFSISGIVGGIAGTVGFSFSSPPRETTPKYKIEMPDQISAEINCRGNIWNQNDRHNRNDEHVEVALGWQVKLNEGEREALRNGQQVSKEATVSIKRVNGNQNWWPVKKGEDIESLWVFVKPQTEQLGIYLRRVQESKGEWRGRSYVFVTHGGTYNRSLSCDKPDLLSKSGNERKIYEKSTRRGYRGKYDKQDTTTPLKVNVSLEKCEPKEKGKPTECLLKVLTGTDLDWSSKVDKKATITLE